MTHTSDATGPSTIVIGGGQAGLAVGYHLAKRGLPFLILDAQSRVGDAWRNRWDSLRLFSPAGYSGLPGLRFPGRGSSFPGKDQVADYLADYARKFNLPVRNNVTVDRVRFENGRFTVAAGNQRFESQNVVVAMANFQAPRVPAFASGLDPGILQLHSTDYRSAAQLRPGGVLIVGAGNSGADIAMDVVRSHPVWLSGKEPGFLPWRIDTLFARLIGVHFIRFIGHHVLTVATPMGRRLRHKLLRQATPLIRVKPADLVAAGVQRVPKTAGVRDGLPALEDGRTLAVKNVIWCTGYKREFPWIDLPVFGSDGEPLHENGIVRSIPGLYFVGLHFLYAMSSATLVGVGRDAKRIARAIACSLPLSV